MNEEFRITDAFVRKILDSRGNQTVEAEIILPYAAGRCSAPAGASTGEMEVQAYPKEGIDRSIEMFESRIRNRIIGFDALDQYGFDSLLREVDGTGNFSEIGGNLSTVLSVALAKAASNAIGIPLYRYAGGHLKNRLPKPIGNVLGGGAHSKNGTTIQEFMVSAQGKTMIENITLNSLVHKKVGARLREIIKDQSIGVGDERAWTASISDDDAIDVVKESAHEVETSSNTKILLGVDFAASNFFDGKKYKYRKNTLDRDEQIEYACSLVKSHGFYYIEDPMDEHDFDGFAEITRKVGSRALIVGDDIYTTDAKRIAKGIEMKAGNAVLIKVNQIGTLTDTWEAVNLATTSGWKTTISHRSGETTDDFIAHLGTAFQSEFIKTGTIGGERVAKLNELVRIEEEIQH